MSEPADIQISTDKSKLDILMIHQFLTHSYWAKGRSIEQVRKSIAHTTCFGLYLNGKQIGFTRVLSDQVVYAYLMDVFVLSDYQGNGYGKQLLQYIMEYPDFLQVKIWFLATKDAHGLYEQFGFIPLPEPAKYMIRKPQGNN